MTGLLFRHLLESTLFCFLFGSLAFLLRRQSAAVRHSVWLISILKFSIPTVLFTATGAWMALVLPATAWASLWAAKFSAILTGLFGIWPSHIVVGAGTITSRAFMIVWLLGSACVFGAWLNRLRNSHSGLSLAANDEREALDRAKWNLGSQAAIELRCSERSEPALIGVFRPRISIPSGLAKELTTAEFEAVLMHELAHARRRDNLASAMVHCLVCLFWFHPLLWFVEKRLIAERERACDEMVIASGVAPKTYLAGILKVCRFHVFGDLAGVSAMNGSALGRRSNQILAYRAAQPVPYAVRLAMAGFAMLVTLLPIAGGYCQQCSSNGQVMKSPTKFRKDKR